MTEDTRLYSLAGAVFLSLFAGARVPARAASFAPDDLLRVVLVGEALSSPDG